MAEMIERNMVEIPEKVLRQSAETMAEMGDFDNSFTKMLDVIEEYKRAELTPIVLYNVNTGDMLCVVKELYGKKLH